MFFAVATKELEPLVSCCKGREYDEKADSQTGSKADKQ
jgi:hypothetical protein